MILELTLFTLIWVLLLGIVSMYLKWHWQNMDNKEFEQKWEEREEVWRETVASLQETVESLSDSFDNMNEMSTALFDDYQNAVAENIEFREGKELDLAKHYRGAIFLDHNGNHTAYNRGELVIDEQVTFFEYIKGQPIQFYVTHFDGHNIGADEINL